MAEGFAKALKSDVLEASSAGTKKAGMNPRAVKVMEEAGISLDGQYSKTLSELPGLDFDYVITLCGHAKETCPSFPGNAVIVHHGFDDPPYLTKDMTIEDEILPIYRRVRDEIKAYIETLPESLPEKGDGPQISFKF
jgi:arsenate reductase